MDKNLIKELLNKKHKEINNTLEEMKHQNSLAQTEFASSELSNYDNHPADIASQLYESEHNSALMKHEKNLINDIKEAIARIDNGTYGQCVECGKDIAVDRLKAVPSTKLCIYCENNKSKLTQTLIKKPPHFEQTLKNEKLMASNKGLDYEGMDQLNDVMKYGSSDTPQDIGNNKDLKDFYTNKIDRQGIVEDVDDISNDYYKDQL